MWSPERIRARLAALRDADPELARFGARHHRYRLGSPLTAADIESFEAQHGVTLPESYRTFLLHVGNGGAGPYLGLFRLDGEGIRDYQRDERSTPGFLTTPFPHTEAWNPMNPWLPEPRMSEDEYHDRRWVTGSLVIAEFGCGAFYRLVLTGPARGQVWFDDVGCDGGLVPETEFRDWYEGWLDSCARTPPRRT